VHVDQRPLDATALPFLGMVQHRLYRNIRRVLSDSFEQDVEIAYITYDDWQERSQ